MASTADLRRVEHAQLQATNDRHLSPRGEEIERAAGVDYDLTNGHRLLRRCADRRR